MAQGNPLVNLGELSKPATVFIEKVSDAVGGICKPWQMKRVAKAEAEVEKIRALSGIELSGIEQRAMHRLVAEEAIKQENIENITAKAVKELKADAKPENLERDWVANFFDKCRLVSDTEMQSLWSKLLAGEANEPGAFSKRTIELVASLDKEDAYLFTTLMGFACYINDDPVPVPFVYDFRKEIYNERGINFGILNHLDSIGLVNFQDSNDLTVQMDSRTFKTHYFGKETLVDLQRKELKIGSIVLTKIGFELAPICGASSVPDFLEYVLKEWQKLGYKVSRQ
ncbi:MAG: DUF2806 domain-containing protein [Nitrospina sp.]|jgi:hypothetical protein|nr:DUF2806 domain-containing protein [Nitrospina sp.]MBT3413898.1 DUF2806 domain-containing protein [Nitrospina sp.]MBT3857656.1 DUF2806 domain-containing protein [Nitrospina sp.]MBT4105089.1 DUF2806 domain-containing protein [Nitrospina sp.]MBT4389341.1 DUF2806 domain-containing protein [Nitrospina sp.]